MTASDHLQPRQFYHGSGADIPAGEDVEPRGYLKGWEFAHFTSDKKEARDYATRVGTRRGFVYNVEPTGPIERDHTDDSQTAFRSRQSLRITGKQEAT